MNVLFMKMTRQNSINKSFELQQQLLNDSIILISKFLSYFQHPKLKFALTHILYSSLVLRTYRDHRDELYNKYKNLNVSFQIWFLIKFIVQISLINRKVNNDIEIEVTKLLKRNIVSITLFAEKYIFLNKRRLIWQRQMGK